MANVIEATKEVEGKVRDALRNLFLELNEGDALETMQSPYNDEETANSKLRSFMGRVFDQEVTTWIEARDEAATFSD